MDVSIRMVSICNIFKFIHIFFNYSKHLTLRLYKAIEKLKRGPKNKHRVKDSIVEENLAGETSQFCSYYFRDEVACSRNRPNRHQDDMN